MKTILLLLVSIILSSCIQNLSDYYVRKGIAFSNEVEEVPIEPPRKWTVMMYMAADNNLEANAIQDINELETFDFDNNGIRIVSLLDRSIGFDGTNGDWADTRLLEITKDEGGDNGIIISKELSSQELALEQGVPTELDMANPNTLKSFLQFVYEHYESENYALIIWGHGNGWRSITSDTLTNSTMSLSDLQYAIKSGRGEKKLDVIALDTSFGATIEMLWDLKDEATYFAGTGKVLPNTGWNYKDIFSSFLQSDLSHTSFITAISTQSESTVIELQQVESLIKNFENFTSLLALQIDSIDKQKEVKNLLFSNIISYKATTYPTDMFLDIGDLSKKVSENVAIFSNDTATQNVLKNASTSLQTSLNSAAVFSSEKSVPVSVFFISFKNEGVPETLFPTAYIQNPLSTTSINFVQNCTGWPPSITKNISLLDLLFFTVF